MGRGGILTLIATLSVLTLLLAAVATWHGYWPVLAIATVQVILLAPLLLYAWRSTWAVETITLDSGKVFVLRETWKARQRLQLDAAWTRVWVEPPGNAWYPPRVILGTDSSRIELGRQLNSAERRQLAGALREAIFATGTTEPQV